MKNSDFDFSDYKDAGKIPVDRLRDPINPNLKTSVHIGEKEEKDGKRRTNVVITTEDELGRMISEEFGYIEESINEKKEKSR